MVERVNGYSGIDVDGTIKKLMQANRIPLDKLKQKKQVLEWQRDDYRTMNSKILDLRNAAFNMQLQGPYLTKTASSDQESIVTVKGTGNAIAGNYTVEITQAATTATINSGTVGTKAPLKGAATTLDTLGVVGNVAGNEMITINGEKGTSTIQVNKKDSISTMVSNINTQSSKTGVRVNYDEAMDKFFFTSINTGSQAKVDLKFSNNPATNGLIDKVFNLAGLSTSATVSETTSTRVFTDGATTLVSPNLTAEQKFTVTYNGKPSVQSVITINKDTTISQLMTSINTSDVGKRGVSAYLDSGNKLVIVNPDTTLGGITFTDTDGDRTKTSLGLVNVDPNNGKITDLVPASKTYQHVIANASTGSVGKDAKVKFNNSAEVSYSSNTFSINGIEFSAKKAAPGTKVSVAVSQDTASIFNSIKSLIDKYNDTVDTANKKITEEKYRSYQPLTDDQRTSLSVDQVKQWEDKAKSGLLKNDFILSSGINSLRLGLGSTIGGLSLGDLKQLSEIGIKTSADYTQKGKLIITDDDLRKAIAEQPEQVMNLFRAKDDSTSDSGHGIAVRMYDISARIIDSLKTKAGTPLSSSKDFDIGKDLDRLTKQIDNMNTKLTNIEDRYYKKFSAMEAAISKYSAQSSVFASISGTSK